MSFRESQIALLRTALFLAIAIFSPARLWAWGCVGHETVALIAEAHLTPHARSMANRILEENRIDPSLERYCKQPNLDPIAYAATWADDYRQQHPETGQWHFIDIPRGAPRGNLEKYCPAGACITTVLKRQIKILETTQDPARQANALRFIIHLVGDLHQPLHDTTNDDQGGNCVPVTFFDQIATLTNAERESYSPNLHSIWDSFIVERLEGAGSVEQVAAILDRKFSGRDAGWQSRGIQIDDWAWQSHDLAEIAAYGDLPRTIAVEKPHPIDSCAGDNDIGSRMFALNETVAGKYQKETAPIIEQQLAEAGIRLAMILNGVWK
jgi:hypothetical protein